MEDDDSDAMFVCTLTTHVYVYNNVINEVIRRVMLQCFC